MKFDYVRQYYNVPAEFGRRVRIGGKLGTIVEDRGHYIGVNMDCDKPSTVHNYHPTDGVDYLDEVKAPRKPSRSAARYQRYLKFGDMLQSFRQFLSWDSEEERSWNK